MIGVEARARPGPSAGENLRYPTPAEQRTSHIMGAWFLGTFVFSIPAYFFYGPILDQADYITGSDDDTRVANGALLEILLAVSGLMLWLGERFASFRTEGAILVHDWVTYVSLVLLAGHLYLSVLHPATRHALRGVTLGTVDEEWARRHHAKWVDDAERQ